MKVLHIIPSFGPGGAERQLSLIASALSNSGVECHIGYCSEGPNIQYLVGSSVHLHKIPINGNYDPRLFWHVWRLISAVKPDIVQTWILQMDIVGAVVAMLARVPFIVSERSSKDNYALGWKAQLRIILGRQAQCVIANSRGGVEYWRSQSSKLPLFLIRNCIPLNENNKDTAKSTAVQENESPIILFIGRLSYEKNVFVMIKAFIEVLNIIPSANAHIFGEGEFEVQLRAEISKAKLAERIHIHGYSNDLDNWMALADVCVSTSNFEGNPNVVLEAAAASCPLVISNIAAHREILDDKSATFAEPESPDEFAMAILFLLRNKNVAKMKALQAKKIIQDYGMSNVIESYLAIYEKILARK